MATKKLKTIEVHQMLFSSSVPLTDTPTDMKASMALLQFEKHQDLTVEMEIEDNKILAVMPYHSIQYIKVTEANAEYEKADPHYCEETEGGN